MLSALPRLGLLLSLLALPACSEDRTEPHSVPDPAPAPSATRQQTEPEEPVTPAAGPLLEQDAVTVNLPKSWKLTENQTSFLVSGLPPARQEGLVTLSQLPAPDSVTARQIERTIARAATGRPARVLEPLDVNGVRMVRVARADTFTFDSTFAASYASDLITLTIKVDTDLTETRRDELIASVLASVVWR